MAIDLPSLALLIIALTMTSAVLAGYVWRVQTGHAGLGTAAAGFVLIAVASLSYAVLPLLFPVWLMVVVNNVCFLGGLTAVLNGFLAMTGRPRQWWFPAVVLAVTLAAALASLGHPEGLALRAAINALALAAIHTVLGASLWRVEPVSGHNARTLAVLVLADGGWHAIRAAVLLADALGWPIAPLENVLGLHAIVQICFLVTALIAMSQLINNRLLTELRRAEALLARDLQAERDLASLRSGFVSMASHEFRTPLAIIDAAAQRLAIRERPLAPQQTQDAVRSIRNAVQRIVLLIDTMLDPAVTRSEGLRLSAVPCDLAGLVRAACERHGGVVRARTIEHDVDGLPQVVCDPDLIAHALGHLLSNADKYSPGSSVIRVAGRSEGGRALIAVTDHGIGIAAEDRARIFEPFYRAPNARAYQGTGMGLGIVREIMALHRGDILVDGELGRGTTITLSLPLAA